MNTHTDVTPETAVQNPNRLEPMLIRLPPSFAAELRNLARRTRVRQSDYLREAVADLLAKYAQPPAGVEGDGSPM